MTKVICNSGECEYNENGACTRDMISLARREAESYGGLFCRDRNVRSFGGGR